MEAKEILKELVKFDTYKDKENKEIMYYIESLLKEKGFNTEYKSKCLVMNNKEKCKLAFIGHTDTVQAGKNWTNNSLKLLEKDGKLFGLGTCDMKGGIAAIIKAVMDIDWNNYRYGIRLIFTYDEEIGFKGIKEINSANIEIPENVIIGEPSENVELNGSKGLLEFKILFKGKATHSSNPSNGINAIYKCMDFLNELKNFYNELRLDIDNRFDIPYTTMNIGIINGGNSINIVPNECHTYVDYRIINCEQRERILVQMEQLKNKYACEYEIINDIKPFISESEYCKTMNGITEASLIEAKNRIILGTGPMTAHEADEYITIESLNQLVEQYKSKIIDLCK